MPEKCQHCAGSGPIQQERLSYEPCGHCRAWRKRRTGPPYIKPDRKALYPLADVEAWERAQRVEPSGR